jgi:two-component system sensor histidine kinase UhpB
MRTKSSHHGLFGNLTTLSPSLRFFFFLASYCAAYKAASLFSQAIAAPLWLPDSVLLCWLLASPSKQWWVYLIASLPIRLVLMHPVGVPLWFVLVTSANDSLKGLFAAYVLRRALGFPVRCATLRAFTIFVATAAIFAPLFSALLGAAARYALGYGFWTSGYQWFLGNALASLLITPTLLFWIVIRNSGKRRFGELALLLAGLAVASYYAFVIPHAEYSPLLLYIPLPFLVWATLRTGPAGTSAALSVLSIFSILSADLGKGIFSVSSPSHNLLSLQLFLLVVSVPLLFLAVVMEERQKIQKDLRRTQKFISENNERLRSLAGRLINSQEEERRRIARELHDDIGQRLALLINDLDEHRHTLAEAGRNGRTENFSELHQLATDLATDIHELSHELHSTKLKHLGLSAALKDLCQKISPQQHIPIVCHAEGVARDLPADLALCLFRVAQEALSNVVRHSKASEAMLEVTQAQDVIILQVKDSGVGFDPSKLTPGLGFSSMRERLGMFGGDLLVRSAAGKGTDIVAKVKLRPRAKAAAAGR